MTQYAFYFDNSRCTGCKTCELASKDYKDLDRYRAPQGLRLRGRLVGRQGRRHVRDHGLRVPRLHVVQSLR